MTDKKFTDEQIIKALKCMLGVQSNDPEYSISCYGCAFEEDAICDAYCSDEMAKVALDLINRQKAEVERLKKRISDKKHTLLEQQTYTAELQRKLETKCDDCDNIRLSRPEYWKAIKAAKAEAYKEFAERLIKNSRLIAYANGFDVKAVVDVEEIVKIRNEMVGEE